LYNKLLWFDSAVGKEGKNISGEEPSSINFSHPTLLSYSFQTADANLGSIVETLPIIRTVSQIHEVAVFSRLFKTNVGLYKH
jgi:hypothetical protein